jgi:hypothetical protein
MVRRSYSAGCLRRPAVWPAPGTSQTSTVRPPKRWYVRATGGAAGCRDGAEPGHDEQDPADDVADARDVTPVEPGVDDVQAVRDDAEADRDYPDDHAEAEPRRPRHA